MILSVDSENGGTNADQDSCVCQGELANAITHAIGVVLALTGLAVMVTLASLHGGTRQVVSYSIYGVTLVLLYAASTVYHGIRLPRAKRILRILDHIAIYLLIAGTYTPFALITLRGAWGWSLLGIIWALAGIGVIFKCFFTGRFARTSTLVYLAMGWLALVAVRQLFAHLPVSGLVLLFAGGLCYSAGVVFFACDHKWRFNHAIWHLFVLGGSICHFFAVMISTW